MDNHLRTEAVETVQWWAHHRREQIPVEGTVQWWALRDSWHCAAAVTSESLMIY